VIDAALFLGAKRRAAVAAEAAAGRRMLNYFDRLGSRAFAARYCPKSAVQVLFTAKRIKHDRAKVWILEKIMFHNALE